VDNDGDAVTYSLSDDFHGWFTIDPSTGVVSVAGNIDYESNLLTNGTAKITVTATSADGSSTTGDFTITVTDDTTTDTDDVLTGKTISDTDAVANEVSESASTYDPVHITAHVADNDGDAITYALIDNFHGWF
ncbi:cadherin repeat domain-containing protein, partial [Marinifilum sp. D737]|uniref:cadherin repeat domain-containing protein n=1 Tax=Marinifilum sp. D737 TaxID=2969628 RepID=UPI002272F67F